MVITELILRDGRGEEICRRARQLAPTPSSSLFAYTGAPVGELALLEPQIFDYRNTPNARC